MSSTQLKGSIIQLDKDKPKGKCRKWRLVVYLGKDALTGKHRQKVRRFTGTYSEANDALSQLIDEIESLTSENKAITTGNRSYTFKEYRELFIKIRKASGDVAPGTVKREDDKLKSLGYLIDDFNLKDITPLVLDNAYADLKAGKSKSGKRLSGTYISDIHKKVNLMMAHAQKGGYIKSNPCLSVKPPKQDTKEKRSLQGSAIQKLLTQLNPSEPMQCGVMLCTTLGLRRGEAVGLSWEDINLEKGTIHICHSYDDAGNLSKPKTKAGNRILPLPEIALNALKDRQQIQLIQFKQYAPDLIQHDEESKSLGIIGDAPIISDQLGNRIHPAGLGHWWYNHRSGFGLDGWTLHELRHTFLTLAAEKGVHPSVMQKLAGHSTSRLTMDIYTHVNMDAQREAMASMQDVFSASA